MMISFILSWYRLVWGIKEVRDGAGESEKGGIKQDRQQPLFQPVIIIVQLYNLGLLCMLYNNDKNRGKEDG